MRSGEEGGGVVRSGEAKRRELLPVTDQLERIAERRGAEVETLAANLVFRSASLEMHFHMSSCQIGFEH